jgi:predicted nucleic acid-binding protein
MRIFLDANIIVAVLNKEYPVFTHAARIISLAGKPGYKVFTTPLCLAIAFYFSEKKSGRKNAKEKIALLCKHLSIASINEIAVTDTINKKINDFEDGLEYYAALQAKCDVIVTEDTKDFFFSDIAVADAATFFNDYLGYTR